MREITWELVFLGFRVELECLDRHLCPSSGDLDEVQQPETYRRMQVAQVFGGRPLCPAERMQAQPGLCSPELQDRADSLEALRRVMSRWPGIGAEVTQYVGVTRTSSADAIQDLERKLSRQYAQTFFNSARRAPIVLRTVP